MKKLIWMLGLAAILIACAEQSGEAGATSVKDAPSKEERQEQIAQLETKLKADPDMQSPLQKATANELVTLYKGYVTVNPHDSISAEYLFKAADLSVGLGQYEASIRLLDRLTNDFPTYERIVEMWLFKGFIYETYMDSHANAVKAYKSLIEKYPNHRLAQDARAAIDNLTLSEEELIEKFKKANEEKPAS